LRPEPPNLCVVNTRTCGQFIDSLLSASCRLEGNRPARAQPIALILLSQQSGLLGAEPLHKGRVPGRQSEIKCRPGIVSLLLKRRGKFSASTSPGKLALTTPEQIGKVIFAALASDATHNLVKICPAFLYARGCLPDYATGPGKASRISSALLIKPLYFPRFLLESDFGNAEICLSPPACRQVSPRESSSLSPNSCAPGLGEIPASLCDAATSRLKTLRGSWGCLRQAFGLSVNSSHKRERVFKASFEPPYILEPSYANAD
jgi:hypothetical protein